MPLSSRLKALGVAAAILAGALAVAQAEVITSESEARPAELEASPVVNAVIKPRPGPIGHRRRHAGDMLHDVRQDTVVQDTVAQDAVVQDAVARNEEEFDRRFGMCRRC